MSDVMVHTTAKADLPVKQLFREQAAMTSRNGRSTDVSRPMKAEIEAAARTLNTDIKGLARRLEISVGSLRSWSVRGGPVYARLALAALVLGVDPDKAFHQDSNVSSSAKRER